MPSAQNSHKLLLERLELRCLLASDLDEQKIDQEEQTTIDHAMFAASRTDSAVDLSDLSIEISYRAGNEKVDLANHPTRLAVAFSSGIDASSPLLDELGLEWVRPVDSKYVVVESESGLTREELVASLQASASVVDVLPVFYAPNTKSEAVAIDEVIVALNTGVSATDFFRSRDLFSHYRQLAGAPDQFVATLAKGKGRAVIEAANDLSNDPQVAWAGANFYQNWKRHFTPNDPRLPNQWHLNNTGQGGGKVDADSDLPEAWDLMPGVSPAYTLAVVDDGVDAHPDLTLWVNPGEIANDSIDNDGNGWVDDINGWNFVGNNNVSNNSTVNDMHGTSVAGVAAARGNNSLGVAGAAYNASVMSARIFQNGIAGSDAALASALYYVGGRKASGVGTWKSADIVNNSWGGGSPSLAIATAIQWGTSQGRQNAGATYLFSSGNGFDAVSFPAVIAPFVPGMLSIGASSNFDIRSIYSNYGPELDLVAPSNDLRLGTLAIDTTDRTGTNGYAAGDYTGTGATGFGGTSSAAPFASGIATLVLARAESLGISLTSTQIEQILMANTDLIGGATYDLTTGKSLEFGTGRLNAFSAVSAIGRAEISVTDATTEILAGANVVGGSALANEAFDMTMRVRNQGTSTLNLGALTVSSANYSVLSAPASTTLGIGESTTFVIRFTASSVGSYVGTVSLTSNDLDEATFSFSLTVNVIAPSVSGYVFEDWDGDGVRDTEDRLVNGRVAFLDANQNGQLDTSAAATFTTSTALAIPDLTTVRSPLTVSGSTNLIADLNVRVNITHTWDSDLIMTLISPSGRRVLLVLAAGANGDNFTNTTFDDEAVNIITNGSAPFTGSFRPLEKLNAFDGTSANGTWQLEVTDIAAGDPGNIVSWSLIVTTIEPNAPVRPSGYYAFPNLANGNYTVRLAALAGWTNTGASVYPTAIASASDSFTDRHFAVGFNNRFYGLVFNDRDSNGSIGANEEGRSGRTLLEDLNANGVLDNSVTVTQSNVTAVPIPDLSTVTSTINVTSGFGFINDVNVRINLNHTFVADLVITLIHPDGTRIPLVRNIPQSATAYSNTQFDDQATQSIYNAIPPFTGSFRPDTPLTLLNNKAVNGIWTLEIRDALAADSGTLVDWQLSVTGRERFAMTSAFGTAALDLTLATSTVTLVPLVDWQNTIPISGARTVNVAGAPLFDQRFGVKEVNHPPTIGRDNGNVVVNEGSTVTNTGTWADVDAGNTVTLSASTGTVVKNANGTWSWSIAGSDDRASTSVVITADDGAGGTATTSFTYAVNNLAPTVSAQAASVNGLVLSTISNTGSWGDVPADTVTLTASSGTIVKNANGTWSWSIQPTTAINNQVVTITASDEDGGSATTNFSFSALVGLASSRLYYKDSTFSAGGTAVNNALDANKTVAKSGATPQTLSFANVSNYSRGINGLVLDVAGLVAPSLSASDFTFRVSPQGTFNSAANPPSGWVAADSPTAIIVTPGNSTTPGRIQIEWADNAIQNRWLQIRLLAGANTGLLNTETFYLGHLRGEVDGQLLANTYLVLNSDILAAAPVGRVATVNEVADLDKNGFVLTSDLIQVRQAINANLALTNITIPAAGSGAEGAAAGTALPSLLAPLISANVPAAATTTTRVRGASPVFGGTSGLVMAATTTSQVAAGSALVTSTLPTVSSRTLPMTSSKLTAAIDDYFGSL